MQLMVGAKLYELEACSILRGFRMPDPQHTHSMISKIEDKQSHNTTKHHSLLPTHRRMNVEPSVHVSKADLTVTVCWWGQGLAHYQLAKEFRN